jgi:quinol monooxygenase YgiN
MLMSDGNCFIVTYLEVAPASVGPTVALLKQREALSRKSDGNARVEVLRRSAPSNQFALVSIWRDQQAFETSRDSAATKDIHTKLAPHLITAIDTRVHSALIGGPDTPRGQGTTFIVTHIDVPPPNKDACIELVKAQVEASRKDPGCAHFEVFQQADRPNHFSVIEAWNDRAAFDAHIVTTHSRDFRKQLTPLSGGLYDERIYEAVK